MPQHQKKHPQTAVQMKRMGTAYQLYIYTEACFCLLPVEDVDGEENKVFISVH